MKNSNEIDEEKLRAQAAACYSLEQFLVTHAGDVYNAHHLSVAAYHAGMARGLYRAQDLVDTLEQRLSKREAKVKP